MDNVVFEDIVDHAQSMSYQPGTVTQTTYFRRLTHAVNESCTPHPSSVHQIKVIALDPGVFDPAHSKTICYGLTPNEFSTSPLGAGQPGQLATSNNANLTFQWEKSTDNGENWLTITGAAERNYTSPALSESTWFKRRVKAELDGVTCEDFTQNIIKINVISEIIKGSIHSN